MIDLREQWWEYKVDTFNTIINDSNSNNEMW